MFAEKDKAKHEYLFRKHQEVIADRVYLHLTAGMEIDIITGHPTRHVDWFGMEPKLRLSRVS